MFDVFEASIDGWTVVKLDVPISEVCSFDTRDGKVAYKFSVLTGSFVVEYDKLASRFSVVPASSKDSVSCFDEFESSVAISESFVVDFVFIVVDIDFSVLSFNSSSVDFVFEFCVVVFTSFVEVSASCLISLDFSVVVVGNTYSASPVISEMKKHYTILN